MKQQRQKKHHRRLRRDRKFASLQEAMVFCFSPQDEAENPDWLVGAY